MRRPARLDWALAGLALAVAVAELAVTADLRNGFALNVVAAAAIVAPLAWWRTWPLRATACLLAVALPAQALTSAAELPAIWFTLLALAFGLGAHEDGRGAAAGVGLLFCGIVATSAISGSLSAGDVVFPTVLVVAFCLAGRRPAAAPAWRASCTRRPRAPTSAAPRRPNGRCSRSASGSHARCTTSSRTP